MTRRGDAGHALVFMVSDGLVSVDVLGCSERSITLVSRGESCPLLIGGTPGGVVRFARRILDRTVAATDRAGETCAICRRRGLNEGRFATFVAGKSVHVGCLADYRHEMRAGVETDGSRWFE
jgi:hypothetical protein